MARVFSGAADTVRCEENTWRLNAGPIDLYPRRWIGYCREQDHISPATKRASDEERTAHRSWSFSHLLIKGLFHGKTLALTVTGCGQDEIDRQCSDPLLIAHPHLDPHPLSAFKFFQDKYPGFYGQKYLRNGDGGSGYAEAEIARSLQLGGIPIVSAIGGKKGGLHGSDLLSPAPKVNRSGLDLTILTKKQKKSLRKGTDPQPPTNPSKGGIQRMKGHSTPGGTESGGLEAIQIFIKSLSGNTICMQIKTGMLIKNIKDDIQELSGISASHLSLIYAGHTLQEEFSAQHYGIVRDSTIFLSSRLRGGSFGSSSRGTGSFKDAVKGKGVASNKTVPPQDLPGPYIVEKSKQNPVLKIDLPEVKNFHDDLSSLAVICRFNGFWPKTDALRQWIHSTWTPNCDILLCTKGFLL